MATGDKLVCIINITKCFTSNPNPNQTGVMSQELFITLEFPPAAFGASMLQVAGNKFCRAYG